MDYKAASLIFSMLCCIWHECKRKCSSKTHGEHCDCGKTVKDIGHQIHQVFKKENLKNEKYGMGDIERWRIILEILHAWYLFLCLFFFYFFFGINFCSNLLICYSLRVCEKPIEQTVYKALVYNKSIQEVNEVFKTMGIPCSVYEKKEEEKANKKPIQKKVTKVVEKTNEDDMLDEEFEQVDMEDDENLLFEDSEELENSESTDKNATQKITSKKTGGRKKKKEAENERKIPTPSGIGINGNELTKLYSALLMGDANKVLLEHVSEDQFVRFTSLQDSKWQTTMSKRLTLFFSQYKEHKDRRIYFVLSVESSESFKLVIERMIDKTLKEISQFQGRKEKYFYYTYLFTKRLALIIFVANYKFPLWSKTKDDTEKKNYWSYKTFKSHQKRKISVDVLDLFYEIFQGVQETITELEMFCILDILIQDWLLVEDFLYGSIKGLYEHFIGSVMIVLMKEFGELSKFKTSNFF